MSAEVLSAAKGLRSSPCALVRSGQTLLDFPSCKQKKTKNRSYWRCKSTEVSTAMLGEVFWSQWVLISLLNISEPSDSSAPAWIQKWHAASSCLFLECLIPNIDSDAADTLFVLRMLWNTVCTWSVSLLNVVLLSSAGAQPFWLLAP